MDKNIVIVKKPHSRRLRWLRSFLSKYDFDWDGNAVEIQVRMDEGYDMAIFVCDIFSVKFYGLDGARELRIVCNNYKARILSHIDRYISQMPDMRLDDYIFCIKKNVRPDEVNTILDDIEEDDIEDFLPSSESSEEETPSSEAEDAPQEPGKDQDDSGSEAEDEGENSEPGDSDEGAAHPGDCDGGGSDDGEDQSLSLSIKDGTGGDAGESPQSCNRSDSGDTGGDSLKLAEGSEQATAKGHSEHGEGSGDKGDMHSGAEQGGGESADALFADDSGNGGSSTSIARDATTVKLTDPDTVAVGIALQSNSLEDTLRTRKDDTELEMLADQGVLSLIKDALSLHKAGIGRDYMALVRVLERIVKRKVGAHGLQSPRIAAKSLVKEMVAKSWRMHMIRRHEMEPDTVCLMADVSGSCAAHADEYLAAILAVRDKYPYKVILLLHFNGVPLAHVTPSEVILFRDFTEYVDGDGRRERYLKLYGELFTPFGVSEVIALGDGDANWLYRGLSERGIKVVQMDHYLSATIVLPRLHGEETPTYQLVVGVGRLEQMVEALDSVQTIIANNKL